MKTQRAVSFDESTMESCSLTSSSTLLLQDDRPAAAGGSCESCESCDSSHESATTRNAIDSNSSNVNVNQLNQEVTSLEEAKTVIAALRARQRAQAHQMLAWRRTLKLQEELVSRLTREKAEQLRSLSSQLLLFESRLCRKQKEIEASLAQRESIILKQQKIIKQLQNKLKLATEFQKNHHASSMSAPTLIHQQSIRDTRDSPPCDALDRLDSLGDSDSAVVLEEGFLDDPMPPRFRSNIIDVTVIRSVSDAVEPANSKYCSSTRASRCNGFLRRPEVLETVYSVEEDADGDQRPDNNNEEAEADEEDNNEEGEGSSKKGKRRGSNEKLKLRDIYGSFERLAQNEEEGSRMEERNGQEIATAGTTMPSAQRTRDESQQAQVTYNRVMSNHRSVTKPKDVKYKRINKAKSKSLEELRGRLRNWVEKGNKIAISLDQSYA